MNWAIAAPARQLRISAAGFTDAGPVRRSNEDHFLLDASLGLFMVADGMGGHLGGEIASRTAVAAIREALVSRAPPMDLDTTVDEGGFSGQDRAAAVDVGFAIRQANEAVRVLNGERQGREAMGTTIVGLLLPEGASTAMVFHVGDSRLYNLRAGKLDCLTRDDSALQLWLEGNRAGPKPRQNVILQALGLGRSIKPTVATFALQPGDLLVLCSDGLSDALDEDSLAAELIGADVNQLATASERLVQAALDAGGRDNVTAVLLAVKEQPATG